MRKNNISDWLFDGVNLLFMLFMLVICLYPFIYVTLASFSDSNLLMAHNGVLWRPLGFNAEAYREVIRHHMVSIGYRNTVFYVVTGTLICMTLTIFGAYALSRKGLVVRKALMKFIVITMFFSGGLIPSYLVIKQLHIFDTVWAILLPGAIGTYNMIVMRTAFGEIPDSLEESAMLDGANEWIILWRIILPLSKPVIAVMVLFYGVGIWNSWFGAAMYLNNRNLYPLQLFLREILIFSNTDSMISGSSQAGDRAAISESLKYATIIVATLPILCVYPFLQKYFVKGVMIGALKG